MNCLHPTNIETPESRFLSKCLKEHKSFEFYYKQANDRRNLLLDPTPLINEPYEYYALGEYVRRPSRGMLVPCGHCDNCIKRRVSDYFVRHYYEWCRARVCGSSWLVTLTYADEHLPCLDDGTLCFNSQHILLFLKRFRRNIEDMEMGAFTYQIVSEYGGEFHRPHYHGLFHFTDFPFTISNQYILKELIAKSWTKVVDRRDWYANVEANLFDMQRVDVQPIKDSRGIKYVCKYLGKQIGSEKFDARKDIPSQFQRRHWQSQGLGMCMYDFVSPDAIVNGCVTIDAFKYPLPMYYKLKLQREFYCYSDDGSIVYQPTVFARDSIANFTLQRLEEYKNLSLLNKDFPIASDILYDPDKLRLLSDWLHRYNGNYSLHDFSYMDLARSTELEDVCEAVKDFFKRVDEWYRPKYAAQALRYKSDQENRFLKKVGMR